MPGSAPDCHVRCHLDEQTEAEGRRVEPSCRDVRRPPRGCGGISGSVAADVGMTPRGGPDASTQQGTEQCLQPASEKSSARSRTWPLSMAGRTSFSKDSASRRPTCLKVITPLALTTNVSGATPSTPQSIDDGRRYPLRCGPMRLPDSVGTSPRCRPDRRSSMPNRRTPLRP